MVIRRWAATLAAAVAAASILSGCTSDAEPVETDAGRTVQLGAPGEDGRELTQDEIAELGQPEYTDSDVAFVQGMIMHHEQALLMTSLVEERTARDDLPKLALRLDVSQHDEIAQLTAWLEARGEQVPLSVTQQHHDHDQDPMPGMLTYEQLTGLAESSGAEFDRLFLEYMIFHHEGAIEMVDELLSGDGAQESEVFQLASHIDGDQRVEISRMTRLLDELP
jgi:uncharacterized protein (DUF305 family)